MYYLLFWNQKKMCVLKTDYVFSRILHKNPVLIIKNGRRYRICPMGVTNAVRTIVILHPGEKPPQRHYGYSNTNIF